MQVNKRVVYTIEMEASEVGKLRWLLAQLSDKTKNIAEEAEAMLFKLPKP